MTDSPTRRFDTRVALAFCVFFASGAAGLVYQVVWSRMLHIVVGVSIYAITAVICTFMAGLAFGSWFIGRRVERFGDPLRTYGVLEAAIGLYALATPILFEALQPVYAAGFRSFDGLSLQLFRVGLSALALILPTALMGGTLPLLSRAITQRNPDSARGVGLLYGVNTLGAVVGCLAAGFVLLEKLGISGSLYLAAGMNFAIAGVAFLSPRVPASEPKPALRESAPDSRAVATGRFVLAVFFVSGFAALGYELLWTRALLVYLRSSTYAFSLMLGIYLLGVALGSVAASRAAERARRPLIGVALCNVGVVISAAIGLLIFPDLDALALGLIGAERIENFGTAVTLMFTQATIILLTPTLFMGAMFPFGIAAYHDAARGVGRSVGSLYAINTTGNIAGSLVVGFLLISLLGVRDSLLCMMALNLGVAGVIGMRSGGSLLARLAWPVAAAALLVGVNLSVSDQIFFQSLKKGSNTEVVFYREGATDTVAVIEQSKPRGRTLIYSDGRGAAGTGSLRWNLYLGHLPMLLHTDPKDVLHICFGSGNSLMATTRHEPDRVDMVELSPHVRQAAKFFWTNESVLENPIVNLVIEDGRNYLLGTDREYDVISMEPPNLFSAGVVNLYTEEFYQLARQRLKPGGIMLQWLPTGQLSERNRGHLIRAIAEAFPWVSIWQQLDSPVLLLIGRDEPLRVDLDRFRSRFEARVPDRDRLEMMTPYAEDFLSYFRLGDESTREMVASFEPVSDDRTIIDYSIPHHIGSGFGFYLHSYPLGKKGHNIRDPVMEKIDEYQSWRDPMSVVVPDPVQAAEAEAVREIRFDYEGRQRRLREAKEAGIGG